jgi:hypothetical protein
LCCSVSIVDRPSLSSPTVLTEEIQDFLFASA